MCDAGMPFKCNSIEDSWIYVTKFKNNTAFEAAMSQPTEEQVRARTHELWTEAGNPAGRSDEFWHQAEQESGNEDKSSPMRASYPNSASRPVDFSDSPRKAAPYKLSPVARLRCRD
jgi:hypothetical protein